MCFVLFRDKEKSRTPGSDGINLNSICKLLYALIAVLHETPNTSCIYVNGFN